MKNIEWRKKAKILLQLEIKKQDINYDILIERLKDIGIEENYGSLSTKINRGAFSFLFFLQCMKALGIKEVRLDNL